MAAATRAERLQALCDAVSPDGTHIGGTAMYTIKQLDPTKWQVRITDPESGDSWGGVGETIDAALTALEAKIR